MKIEYYAYYPVAKSRKKFYPDGDNPRIGITDIRAALPNVIASELMEEDVWQWPNSICVETYKEDVVVYLDEVMELRKNKFSRRRNIEITEDEIDNFDYFFIDVRTLDWGKQIDYEFQPPTCEYEPCPWGSKITSPTRIRSDRIRGLNIARIIDFWKIGTRFIITKKLKDTFEENEITGLKYEPCFIELKKDKKGEPIIFHDRLYVAEIQPCITQQASKIYPHEYCKKHRIIIAYDVCNLITPEEAILPYDFQMIDSLLVKRKKYFYRTPWWFVSRKVLKILLEHAKQDMRPRGAYLKNLFVPVPFEKMNTNSKQNSLQEIDTLR